MPKKEINYSLCKQEKGIVKKKFRLFLSTETIARTRAIPTLVLVITETPARGRMVRALELCKVLS